MLDTYVNYVSDVLTSVDNLSLLAKDHIIYSALPTALLKLLLFII